MKNSTKGSKSGRSLQEDLEEMSEFLVLKSSEEQKLDGADEIVDTASIGDRDGLPVLNAIFDLRHFSPDDVTLEVKDDQLELVAQCTDDSRECSRFRKTMIRRLDLPKQVETRWMRCHLSPSNILTIELPFHLPGQRRPPGLSVVPIDCDERGRRKIRLKIPLGHEFVADDIMVDMSDGQQIRMMASYDEVIGNYGTEVTKRCIDKVFKLPKKLVGKVESLDYYLSADGILVMDVFLKPDRPYTCHVSIEEIPMEESEEGTSVDDSESMN